MVKKFLVLAVAPALLVGFGACEVEERRTTTTPEYEVRERREVDVTLPRDVDIQTERRTVPLPDVDVRQRDVDVDVPTDVDIRTERRTITVPDVDVTWPRDTDTRIDD